MTAPDDDTDFHLDFFFDPVCPFAWQTSQWIRQVAGMRHLNVNWRFICLRIVNDAKDYDASFPDHYREAHEYGRGLLRVCAAVRDVYGPEPIGRLYESLGTALWNQAPASGDSVGEWALSRPGELATVLGELGLPTALAGETENASWDTVLRAETDLAIGRAGSDLGTPILTFDPPDGLSFFGPVISALPRNDEALDIFEAVQTLARFESFAELKRTIRAPLDLPAFRHD